MSEERRRYFNERAAAWDQLATEETLLRLDRLIRGLKIQPGSKVLDVGTGTGITIPILKDVLGVSGRIVAFDLAGEMLKRAKEKHGEKRIRYVEGDISKAPFAESYFDEVLCNSCFPHFQDKEAAVKEMLRILKPGGRAVVCHTMGRKELNSMHKALDSVVYADKLPGDDEMRSLFRQAGFSKITITDSPTGYLLTACKH